MRAHRTQVGVEAEFLAQREQSLFRPESAPKSKKPTAIDPLLATAWQRLAPRDRKKLVQIALILSEK